MKVLYYEASTTWLIPQTSKRFNGSGIIDREEWSFGAAAKAAAPELGSAEEILLDAVLRARIADAVRKNAIVSKGIMPLTSLGSQNALPFCPQFIEKTFGCPNLLVNNRKFRGIFRR
jgi:hypothetical protein